MNRYFQCFSMPLVGLASSLLYLGFSNIEICKEHSLTIKTKKNLKDFTFKNLINPGLFFGICAVGTKYMLEKLYISKLKK